MRKKRGLKLVISLIICFLLGAAPWIVGDILGWDLMVMVFAMIGLSSVSTVVFTKINKIDK